MQCFESVMFVDAQTKAVPHCILEPRSPAIRYAKEYKMQAIRESQREPQLLVQNEMKATQPERGGKLALVERTVQPLDRKPGLGMAPIERVRSTSATLRRIENMQKLIGELAMHEMLADEIAWFLKFSPSGARKYIRDLREAGVIELARYIEGTATYLG